MTSPSWLPIVFFISAVGAGFLSPPSSDLFLPQNPRYFPPVYFKFPVSTTRTTTTEVAVTLSPIRISTYSSPPAAAAPEVRKSPPPPPPPPPPHDHPHPPHDHDHPHPPPPPPPPKKKDRRPPAAQDQDGERGFPGEATLVKFEDWPPVQVYGSQPGINSRVSETLDRSSSPGLESRKDRRPAAADGGGQRSWSGTATPVNVEDSVQIYGSQPSGRIITSKSSRVSGQKTTLDQSSAPLRVTTKSLTGDRRVQVPAPVVVKSRSYSFAPLDGLGSSSETISRSRFQQGRRPSADPVSTTAKSMRARSVPAPVVVRSRSYSFAPPDGLDSSSASTSSRFQQQQTRRSPPPARDVVSNYVQMNA